MFKQLEEIAKDYIEKDEKVALFEGEYQFEVKSNDDESGVRIAGFASTFGNVDRHNDVILPTAFDKTLKEIKKRKRLPMLMDHRAEVNYQAGYFDKFKKSDDGLFVEGVVVESKETEHLIALIKAGAINTFSIGGLMKFNPQQDKKGRNVIEEIMLLETSIVTIPANPKAEFSMKSLFEEKPKEVEQLKPEELSKEEKAAQILKILKG